MTTPKPPEDDNFIAWGIKESQAAALKLRSVHLGYHTMGAVLLLVLAFGGRDAWKWHIEKMARLEAQASVEKTKATNEHKLGEAWKARAIALTDSVRVDTVKVRKLIEYTRVDTVPAQGPALVPMEVVSKLAFDSLGAACTRVEHDCTGALAAKDSVIAHDSAQAIALVALNANTAKQLGSTKRAALLSKIVWGIAGIVIGRASAIH